MTTYTIMEAEALAVMDMVTDTAEADTVTETLSLTAELAELAIADIATAITATVAHARNALARAAMALELAMAKVLAANIAAELAARNVAMVRDPRGKWTHTLKTLDKATSWLWALVKARTTKKLLAAAAAKAKVPEPATETAMIAAAKTAKELVRAKAKVLVLEKELVPLLMRAKVRFLTKAKKPLLAKGLVLAKAAVAVRNPVPTRWNRQLVLNRTLLVLVQLRELLQEWVLEVRALTVRTW